MCNQVSLPSSLVLSRESPQQILGNLVNYSNTPLLRWAPIKDQQTVLTDFAIIIGVERLIDCSNDMFNFFDVTCTQVFITFNHISLVHFPVWTSRLKQKTNTVTVKVHRSVDDWVRSDLVEPNNKIMPALRRLTSSSCFSCVSLNIWWAQQWSSYNYKFFLSRLAWDKRFN